MITITIDTTNATEEEMKQLGELYNKSLSDLGVNSRKYGVSIFLQNNNTSFGSGLGINKVPLLFQSIEHLSVPKSRKGFDESGAFEK